MYSSSNVSTILKDKSIKIADIPKDFLYNDAIVAIKEVDYKTSFIDNPDAFDVCDLIDFKIMDDSNINDILKSILNILFYKTKVDKNKDVQDRNKKIVNYHIIVYFRAIFGNKSLLCGAIRDSLPHLELDESLRAECTKLLDKYDNLN